tara:strand:- start:22 stop:681 length:660 start_codon:yes stop_codon:yes gene_type:complete
MENISTKNIFNDFIALIWELETNQKKSFTNLDKTIISKLNYFDKVNTHSILNFIKSHRLSLTILNHPELKNIIPNSYIAVKNNKEKIKSLFLRKVIIFKKVIELLNKSNIKFLIIKGFPLSYQINLDYFGRLHADLDIFIDPSDLEKTIRILKEINYSTNHIVTKKFLRNKINKFFKYILYEVTLIDENSQFDPIDLHWQLYNFNSSLPLFKDAWITRE